MTYAETAAFGLVLQVNNTGYQTINGVHNFSGPSWACRIAEASHHGSSVVIKKPTIRDPGQISFDIYYDSSDTQHAYLLTSHKNKVAVAWKVTLTDAGAEVYTFTGYISGMNLRADVEGFNVYSITVDIGSEITVA